MPDGRIPGGVRHLREEYRRGGDACEKNTGGGETPERRIPEGGQPVGVNPCKGEPDL